MRILLVDDDPGAIDFVTQVARARGYTDLDVAATAEEALTQAIRQTYDVITLDIQMPGASGLEVLALLRNLSPHAVIALISGHFPEDATAGLTACADVLIDKPVRMDSISRLLDDAARISQAMDQIRLLGRAPAPAE